MSADSEKKPILMVDDNPTDIMIARKCYEKAGLSVPFMSLDGGQSLIDYLDGKEDESELPRVVLLDLNMPYMDGFEALRRIRSMQRFAEPPPKIIIFTNSNDPVDKNQAYELGADGFKTKPIQISDYVAFFKSLVA